MPDRRTHGIAGGATGIAVYVAFQKKRNEPVTLGGVVRSALLGAAGGALPDIVEPPTDPNHRGPAHSLTAGAGVGTKVKELLEDPSVDPFVKECLVAFVAGYGSHLVLDGQTPKGLPIA